MKTLLKFLVLAAQVTCVPGSEAPKTVLDLQPYRQPSSLHVRSGSGKEGTATLVNLNPAINTWYVLTVAWNGAAEAAYHLENAGPGARKIVLDSQYPAGVMIEEANHRFPCDLFGADTLDHAKASAAIFYPLCDGRIYLRNPAVGNRSNLEAATEFLREHVWGGEKIIALGHILMGDVNRETGELGDKGQASRPAAGSGDFPLPAQIDAQYAERVLASSNLGIGLQSAGKTGLTPGAWYAAKDNPGIYVSLLQPDLIDPTILQSYKRTVNTLDRVEASALVYLVAFDLDRFELGYALGTDHPKVGWSAQVLDSMRDPELPGPDGIGSIRPLIATGLIGPREASKTVATFTGGFKRTHGAFKYGALALKNHGSHYGFVEDGVVLSKLQPGLATIFVLNDGSVGMKTWTEADNGLRIKHARQNGVPLIEFDEGSQSGAPGPLVNHWGEGNWSGSEAGSLRTMRAGAAIQRNRGKRFLIYAVFSDATPSAMARIFQAYRCDYAMLLDMNALEHTYSAVYRRSGSQLFVDHLLKGMAVLEKSASAEIIPRFLGYADNRDFFYVMRR